MTSFVADNLRGTGKSALRKIFESAPPGAINFGIGEIQFPTPAPFLSEAAKILKNENISYTPNAGHETTRNAVASYYNNAIQPENVCITVGAEEAVYATLKAIINPGDHILISDPSFVAYETIIGFLGGKTDRFNLIPENDFSIDFKDLRSKISAKTKALIITNPANPTGKSLQTSETKQLLEICRQNSILIICDEVYRELYVENRDKTLLDLYDNSVVVSSLSKSHCMSGWRLGWAVSSNLEIMNAIIVAHQYIATCASYLAQRVAAFALSPAGLNEVAKIREKLNSNRNYTLKKIEATRALILPNDASPYLFLKTKVDDYDLTMKFINKGLIVMPGSIFGKNSRGWIRINYGVETSLLKEGVDILCQEIS